MKNDISPKRKKEIARITENYAKFVESVRESKGYIIWLNDTVDRILMLCGQIKADPLHAGKDVWKLSRGRILGDGALEDAAQRFARHPDSILSHLGKVASYRRFLKNLHKVSRMGKDLPAAGPRRRKRKSLSDMRSEVRKANMREEQRRMRQTELGMGIPDPKAQSPSEIVLPRGNGDSAMQERVCANPETPLRFEFMNFVDMQCSELGRGGKKRTARRT